MTGIVKAFLKEIEDNLKAGNATEHTHRPALKSLLEGLDPSVTATNEPRRIACGAPDFVVSRSGFIAGYLEAKDVGVSLGETERGEQLKRYRRALSNLILTDHLEFRWYVDGEPRQEAKLGRYEGGAIKPVKGGAEAVAALLGHFLAHRTEDIGTPRELAERMARLTHMIRDTIIEAFNTGNASTMLRGWREAFARILIADLNLDEKTPEFADMFAQTLAYGLFTARVMDPTPRDFSRHEAQYLIPKTNPFLRDFFIQISGPQLDDEPFGVFVDDLVNLLAHTDMSLVLAEFGKRTRQEDPVVHFYETFLAAYDPRLRETRGVYYTPEPVVSYIVRSVDYLLKTRFNLPGGLADTSKISIPNRDPGRRVQGKSAMRRTDESHKVLVLDPATGTGTFLYAVIDHIRRQFMERGDAGLWPGYVRDHLLPRLFGFELLMAPYAVAHFKLSLQLAGRDLPEEIRDKWAYTPEGGERLGIYLTNTLEEPHEMSGLPLFTQWVADESNAANEVKTQLPVLVVVGNPPYSVSSTNNGEWIEGLMQSYKEAVRGERNIQPLSDDYIKFFRFAQDRIERTEQGIIAFITNNSYLSGLIHRGIREELLNTFSEIYIINLHGNAITDKTSPWGGDDENVFDIRQGVAITLLIKGKETGKAKVFKYHDLWGSRDFKYNYLTVSDITSTKWQEVGLDSQYFFFQPLDLSLSSEIMAAPSLLNIFGTGDPKKDQGKCWGIGIKTNRDRLLVDLDKNTLVKRIEILDSTSITDDEAKRLLDLEDGEYWNTRRERQKVRNENWIRNIVPYLYRPFDNQWLLYQPNLIEIGRGGASKSVMNQLLQSNLALCAMRQVVVEGSYSHSFVSRHPADNRAFFSNRSTIILLPLYKYPTLGKAEQVGLLEEKTWSKDEGNSNRTPNLSPAFIVDLETKLSLTFNPIQRAAAEGEFGPEDIFHYIYAILHSPTYRVRYAEFLKIDFPRIPLTSDPALFRVLGVLGKELVALHLLESPDLNNLITRYPVPGDNRVEKGYPKFTQAHDEPARRVHINKTQYFEGVPPEVWSFYVGGYQICDKWLKDRRGRQLSYDDLTHYQKVVVALQRTMTLMAEIDATIPEWPIN